jgi:hypothetical protein
MELIGKLYTQHSVLRHCITQHTTRLLRVLSKRVRRGETRWRILTLKMGLPVTVTENYSGVWLYIENAAEGGGVLLMMGMLVPEAC